MKFEYKKYLKNKKVLAVIIIVVLLLISWGLASRGKKNQNPATQPESEKITTGTIPSTPVAKTQADELIDVLITITPIEESTFSLKFDYKNNRFSVTLNPPSNDSYNAFVTWKNDHGFEEIPLEEFHFENYSFE